MITPNNLNRIIKYVLRHNIDISPRDRLEWVIFAHALMLLGYDESIFVALSSGEQRESRQVWRREIKQRRLIPTVDAAIAKIVALAKKVGVNIGHAISGISPAGEQPGIIAHKTRQQLDEVSTPKLPPRYVDNATVSAMEADIENTALYNALCGYAPSDVVRRVLSAYRVGATDEFAKAGAVAPNLASAFPYIDKNGHCIDVHLQPYDIYGHRWHKDEHPYIQNWLLCKWRQSDRRAPWCLFGEHLAAIRPHDPIGIVESEKSAIIAALVFDPPIIWMATGSLNNLTPTRCSGVKGRQLYIFPDNDGTAAWEKATSRLNAAGFKAEFCGKYITDCALPGSKEDIADIILRQRPMPLFQ